MRNVEHGKRVYFADRFVPQKKKARAEKDGDGAASIAFLKCYTMFSIDQCEYLPSILMATPEPKPERLNLSEAEALISATGANFRVGGNQAFYVASVEFIRIPHQTAYADQINW